MSPSVQLSRSYKLRPYVGGMTFCRLILTPAYFSQDAVARKAAEAVQNVRANERAARQVNLPPVRTPLLSYASITMPEQLLAAVTITAGAAPQCLCAVPKSRAHASCGQHACNSSLDVDRRNRSWHASACGPTTWSTTPTSVTQARIDRVRVGLMLTVSTSSASPANVFMCEALPANTER